MKTVASKDTAAVKIVAEPKPRPDVTRRQMMVVFSVLITDAMAMTMLFSYVGLFVAHLGEGVLSRSTAGYVSGFLLGIFQGSQVLVLKHWGHLSDRAGRRPVMLTGIAMSSIMVVCFGLSTNLYMAIVFRFIHGLFTVSGMTVKTFMSEVTNEKTSAAGFSMMSMAWAVGSFVGPSIGGFLYDPNNSEVVHHFLGEDWHSETLATYPALVPSLALASYGTVIWFVAYHFVPESNRNAQPLSIVLPQMWAEFRQWLCGGSSDANCSTTRSQNGSFRGVVGDSGNTAAQPGREGENDDDTEMVAEGASKGSSRRGSPRLPPVSPTTAIVSLFESSEGFRSAEAAIGELESYREANDLNGHLEGILRREEEYKSRGGGTMAHTAPNTPEEAAMLVETQSANDTLNLKPALSYRDVLSHPVLRFVLPMYMIVCSYNICFNEVFPLYAIAFRSDGGLEFTSTLVGVAFMINAIVSFIANSAFSSFSHKFPLLYLWRAFMVGAGLSMFSVGFLGYVKNTSWELALLVPISIIRTSCSTWAFSICMMSVANVAPKKHLGVIVSMSHACGAAARCITPIVASPIFAWSISGDHPFPFDNHLVFILLLGECLFCFYMSTKVSEKQIATRFK